MNTNRKSLTMWGVLRRVLPVLMIALTAVFLLRNPAAGGGTCALTTTSRLHQSPGATEDWVASVQTHIRQGKSTGDRTILALSPTPAWTATGENNDDHFGTFLPSAGDVNGDGYADVIIGAWGYPGDANRGRAYVYHGSPSGLAASPAITFTGENMDDCFGGSVASAGDVNGDGYADVVVGAWGYPGDTNRGRVYVYHGSSSGLAVTPALTLTGENDWDWFGASAASAGDVNGDGYADVIIGAVGYPGGGDQGRVYVYHGSASGLVPTPALTLTGQDYWDYFGHSAASAGDVNGDGYTDAIVGVPGYGSWEGRAYVYHGSPSGLAVTPALTLTGENDWDWFGASAASAGDVNGDGYADVIVEAGGYTSWQGRAYVYHGSPSGLAATPALTLTGERIWDYFGHSVASAGDVNGDGYADAIVGAHGYGRNQGRAYVYHGSPSGLAATPTFSLTGENNEDHFGRSVASAGDVNADGHADFIVGAYGYPSGDNQGKAYVYHGSDGPCVAVGNATISGPTQLPAGVNGLYTASYEPIDATQPAAIAWENGSVGPTAVFSWTVTGTQTIAVTVTNPCGQAQQTFTVTVFCQPLEGVEIKGAAMLAIDQPWIYRAVPQPITASRPLTFTWDTGAAGPTALYSWPLTGTYTVTVTGTNICLEAWQFYQDSLQVEVIEEWPARVYLPLVLREW